MPRFYIPWVRPIYYCRWLTKLLIALSVLLGILVIGIMGFVLPVRQQWVRAQQVEVELKHQFWQQKQQIVERQQLRHRQIVMLQALNRQLPGWGRKQSVSHMIGELTRLAQFCHLRLQSIKPGAGQQVWTLRQQSFSLELTGSDTSVVRWLWLLGQKPWIWQMRQCTLRQGLKQVLHIHLELAIYYG